MNNYRKDCFDIQKYFPEFTTWTRAMSSSSCTTYTTTAVGEMLHSWPFNSEAAFPSRRDKLFCNSRIAARLLQKTLPGFAVNRLASDASVLYPERRSVMIRNKQNNVNLFIIFAIIIKNIIAELILIQEIF